MNDKHERVGNDPETLRELAIQLAREAADLIRRRRPQVFSAELPGGGDDVRSKSTKTDPVTVVDTETEEYLRARLAVLRPSDDILGEEDGGAAVTPGVTRWVIDPIDGTVNFLYNIPAYSVSIAAQIGGHSVAGAVADVAHGRVYSAARGHGAHVSENGETRRLRASRVTDVAMTLLATGFGYDASRRAAQGALIAKLLPKVRDIRRIGSAAIDLCMVADGVVDAHYEHGLNAWDWAAGALIAAEAGATVVVPDSDSPGSAGDVTVAAAPGVASALMAVLTEIGALDPLPA